MIRIGRVRRLADAIEYNVDDVFFRHASSPEGVVEGRNIPIAVFRDLHAEPPANGLDGALQIPLDRRTLAPALGDLSEEVRITVQTEDRDVARRDDEIRLGTHGNTQDGLGEEPLVLEGPRCAPKRRIGCGNAVGGSQVLFVKDFIPVRFPGIIWWFRVVRRRPAGGAFFPLRECNVRVEIGCGQPVYSDHLPQLRPRRRTQRAAFRVAEQQPSDGLSFLRALAFLQRGIEQLSVLPPCLETDQR